MFRSLVRPARFQPAWPEADVFDLLERREEEVNAVVITGGEPLVQTGLGWFMRRIKRMGLAVKLETNGSRPMVLQELLQEKLVDYVALDVKGPLGNYSKFAGCEVDPGEVELAMELVRSSGVDYEFRTTVVGGLHTQQEVEAMAPLVRGARRYVVQTYAGPEGACGGVAFSAPGDALIETARRTCRLGVGEFIVRGTS